MTTIPLVSSNSDGLSPDQSEFLPSDTVGNVIWLDGSDLDGDGNSGGDLVSGTTWVDKSTRGNANALQNVTENTPIKVENGLNELSTVDFDGSQFFDLDSNSFDMLNDVEGVTMFSVLKPMSPVAGQRIVMISTPESQKTRAGLSLFDSASYDEYGSNLGGNGDFGVTGRVLDEDKFQRIEGGNVILGKFHQYTGIIDYKAGMMELYVDREFASSTTRLENPGTTNATDSANIRIGADSWIGSLKGMLNAEIAELIVYNRVLDSDERVEIENYLDQKWNYKDSIIDTNAETIPSGYGYDDLSKSDYGDSINNYGDNTSDPVSFSLVGPMFLILFVIIGHHKNRQFNE